MNKILMFIACLLVVSLPMFACASYEDGYQAAKKGDYVSAFKEFKKNAENGDVSAQYSLAVMYNDGIGVKKNPAEALRWFRKAAENGHPVAIEILKRKK
jgi:TPR repeat protein